MPSASVRCYSRSKLIGITHVTCCLRCRRNIFACWSLVLHTVQGSCATALSHRRHSLICLSSRSSVPFFPSFPFFAKSFAYFCGGTRALTPPKTLDSAAGNWLPLYRSVIEHAAKSKGMWLFHVFINFTFFPRNAHTRESSSSLSLSFFLPKFPDACGSRRLRTVPKCDTYVLCFLFWKKSFVATHIAWFILELAQRSVWCCLHWNKKTESIVYCGTDGAVLP